ncbi:nucleotide sugar dehydrogenase [archaeon]|nr:nucleotide sugar dehydrogenase [archaeon]
MICVVGLGYVGLPLAVRFGLTEKVIGFDINSERIEELSKNIDSTGELSAEELEKADIVFSTNPKSISDSDFIIVAVPTPIDESKQPDLRPLLSASKIVGQNLKPGAIVVFESTVYPGCTEGDCVPVIEKESGLSCGTDFKIGYSPERMNPGDKVHTVDKVVKVVSGMDAESLDLIATKYEKIISAGVHRADSIKIAEAAKIIENTQRDINIALMNELKIIFDLLDIDWRKVIEASVTKWNFLEFSPGLVGGHCIGVDPYYLADISKRLGHSPEIILAGRKINDYMAKYETSRIIRLMIDKDIKIKGAKVVILGATFKPNVSDIRNSKVCDVAHELASYGCEVNIYDPHVKEMKIFGYDNEEIESPDFVVKAVNHDIFEESRYDYGIMDS